MATATVAVMFTDLVDSTALLSRVGEVAAEGLRIEHFSLLRAASADSGGREVKNLGDGLMLVFPSASEAVNAAVAMQRSFRRRNRWADEPMSIRVAIAFGETDVDDDDHFGVPVVQAARLCALCEGGQIVCTDMVRLLGGSRAIAQFEPMGELILKGLDETVTAWRVAWAPGDDVDGVAPMPRRLVAAASDAYVGRDSEYELLTASWKAAAAEADRRVVMLAGEPGIGKTTLAARIAAHVHREDGWVVYGRCDEDVGIPYQPWTEVLSQLVDNAPLEVLTEHVADRGLHAARLVPVLARRVGVELTHADDGDSGRYVLFACVVDLLERLTADQPALVVLDDLHWADRQSLQLFRHVVTAGRPLRLLVVGTFRDSDVAAEHPLTEMLAAFHREHGIERVAMRGLSDTDLLEMLEQLAGHEMDDAGVALRDAVLAETAGNPFFVGEILRHLAETGTIYPGPDGRWVAVSDIRVAGLPVSVREVVGRRLARLGSETERLLSLAAVIGRDFNVELLAAVADVDEHTVIDVCDAAVNASVLQATDNPDCYTFAHALIEHTLYDSLSLARRTRAHRSVGLAIETLDSGGTKTRIGELARHWSAAVQPSDTDRALHYAGLAGDQALTQLAPDDAMRWYDIALGHLDRLDERGSEVNVRRRVEILIGLGIAQRQAGIAEYRETLIEAAQLADHTNAVDLLVRAVIENNRGWASNLDELDHDRLRLIERALERLGSVDSPERARLILASTVEKTYAAPLAETIAGLEMAIGIARRAGDPFTLAYALASSSPAAHPSTLATRIEWTAECSRLARTLDDPMIKVSSVTEELQLAVETADGPGLAALLRELEVLTERVPDAVRQWELLKIRAWSTSLEGDLVTAEAMAEAAMHFGFEHGQPDAFTEYSIQLLSIRLHQGRIHELVDLIDEARHESPLITAYDAVSALAHARNDSLDLASHMLDEAVRDEFPTSEDLTWTTAMACWADAAILCAHREAAAGVRQRLSPYPNVIVTATSTALPSVAYYLGRLDHFLGDHAAAESWFEIADRMHRRLESPLFIAYSDVARAALLADRRESDQKATVRTLADAALATATARGYGYIGADARAVLTVLDQG